MKKMLALLCAAVMLFSLSASAFAETDRSMTYSEISVTGADPDLYTGGWVAFGGLFQVFTPGDWVNYEITEEETAAGTFYRVGPEDGSMLFNIYYLAADTEFSQHFTNDDEAYDYVTVTCGIQLNSHLFNGSIYGYSYYTEADDTGYVVIPLTDGSCYTLTFTPAANSESAPYFRNMILSISAP